MMKDNGARAALLDGNIRKAIALFRQDLRAEANAYERSKIYLSLTRIYRLQVRMNGARLELERAFGEIGLSTPTNSWWAVLLWPFRAKEKLHPDFMAVSNSERTEFLAELYVELGLSAYYLRQMPVVLMASLVSRRRSFELGPSMALLNWYGGTACVLALFSRRRISVRYMQLCQKTARELGHAQALGKLEIWRALMHDYFGLPIDSAKIFERAIRDYGRDLDPADLRLAAVTLSVNLSSRGYAQEALWALSQMEECCSVFKGRSSPWEIDSAAWYRLPALAQLGRTSEISRLSEVFRSNISRDRSESWILAQYLGGLLIAKHWYPSFDDRDTEDLIERFNFVRLKPEKTHFEACYYWIARAYVRSHHIDDRERARRFRGELRNLRRLPSHPVNITHRLILEAKWLLHKKRIRRFQENLAQAEKLAVETDNQWALYELNILKLEFLKSTNGSSDDLSHLSAKIAGIRSQQGWYERRTI